MKFSTLAAVLLCLHTFSCGLSATSGIKGIYVFGDNLSDTGNASLFRDQASPEADQAYPDFPQPYLEGRASNGPVWIEILAGAYGFTVRPALAGGTNYAFTGAESGSGFSDQGTPNFQAQIDLFTADLKENRIHNIHPKDLFVVWFGMNDILRILDDERPITGSDIEAMVGQLARGILTLYDAGGRLFLVPDLPALDLTPEFLAQDEAHQLLMKRLVTAYNRSLEKILRRIEQDPKISILRLSSYRIYVSIFDNPWLYGFENVTEAAILTEPIDPEAPWTDYLSWDGLHPTTSGHAVIAQYAMDVIPSGSWWGHSVARGPDGTAILGMGWVEDKHWPWLYAYSFQDGQWLWAYEETGGMEGFLAYVPGGYKWIWINAAGGWYFDYDSASWSRFGSGE